MPRTVQCKACPWKKSTDPEKDIPGGYDPEKHEKLIACRADGFRQGSAMACHESAVGAEEHCVGWLVNQLGPGNNLALRMRAIRGEFRGLKVDGEQYESLEEMVETAQR